MKNNYLKTNLLRPVSLAHRVLVYTGLLLLLTPALLAREYHVSPLGDDSKKGGSKDPFHTISKAAEIAEPCDIVTVHAGTYREWVRPAHGGAETAAIKFHDAVDVTITRNLIHNVYGRTSDGFSHFVIWLDTEMQGVRVSNNVIFNTGNSLLLEANHGLIM